MADGHLGKCKDCARKDVSERVALKSATDLDWVLSERERHRKKSERQRNSGTVRVKKDYLITLKYRASHPEKYSAHKVVQRAIKSGLLSPQPCEACRRKAQAHHDDYAKPLNVRWLCSFHHAEHHRKQREQKIIDQFKNQ